MGAKTRDVITYEKRRVRVKKLRDELNNTTEDIKPFTKYKIITYIFVFIFPPYGMYRVWKKDSGFVITEKAAQTFVACTFISTLLSMF